MYEALLSATGLVCLAAIIGGSWYYRDTFHPVIYLSALLAALYVLAPAYLLVEGEVWRYLSEQSLIDAQTVYLVGVASLLFGTWRGAGSPVTSQVGVEVESAQEVRLRVGAFALGLAAVAGFAYGIANVGGVVAAFGRSYGGGYSESGYVREMFLLSLPALFWLMVGYQTTRPGLIGWGVVFFVASPLLTQGMLGARRGPTFMAVAGLTVGWYFMRRRRPRLPVLLAAGAGLGVVMLLLGTNRNEIYLGSDFEFDRTPLSYLSAGTGNEYLYGSAIVQHARERDEYYWGGRYAQMFLVRPIPRSLWPTKYAEVSEFLGAPNVESGNDGLPVLDLRWTVGWIGGIGAAPGLIADMWAEFWWPGMLGLFGIGWLYGRSWRKARTLGGAWIPCFGILTALSVYLVLQSLEAMGYRALLMLAGSTVVWYGSKYGALSAAR